MEYKRTPEEQLQRVKETIDRGTKRDLGSMSEKDLLKLADTRLKRVAKAERQAEKRRAENARVNEIHRRLENIHKFSSLLEPRRNSFLADSKQELSPEEQAEQLTNAVEQYMEVEPEKALQELGWKIRATTSELRSAKEDLPAAELQWDLLDQYAKIHPGRRPTREIFVANALRERLNDESITESQYEQFSRNISVDKEKATLSPPKYYRFKIEHGLAVLDALVKLQERFVPQAESGVSDVESSTKPTPDLEPTIQAVRTRALETIPTETSSESEPPTASLEPTPPQSTSFIKKVLNWFKE